MACWFCYWGWPKQVSEIYKKHLDDAGESAMHFGPAHVVWEDENFDRDTIQWCLDNFGKYNTDGYEESELRSVRESLVELLMLPETVLCPQPEDWSDDDDPALFPPPKEVVMIRHR